VEATVHNTKQLGCGRTIQRFPQIVTRLAGMTERFCTTWTASSPRNGVKTCGSGVSRGLLFTC
jgi:hypothetical protein